MNAALLTLLKVASGALTMPVDVGSCRWRRWRRLTCVPAVVPVLFTLVRLPVAVNSDGGFAVTSTGNLTNVNSTGTTAVIASGGIMSIDANFDASSMIDPTSTGIVALSVPNSNLSGVNGSAAFIGSIGSNALSSASGPELRWRHTAGAEPEVHHGLHDIDRRG